MLWVLLLWSGTAQAVSLQALLQQAAQAKEQGDLNTSLRLMREAHSLKPAPELLNNVGYLLQLLGRYEEAVQTYQRVLSMHPLSEKLRALDEMRIRALRKKLTQGWLRIDRAPSQAQIYVDGALVQLRMGQERGFRPGAHFFEVRTAQSSELLLRRLTLRAGLRVQSDLFTRPREDAQLQLRGVEALEVLLIDGYRLRSDLSSLQKIWLSPGRRTVEVRAAGRSRKLDAELRPGASIQLSALLASYKKPELSKVQQIVAAPAPKHHPAVYVLGGLGAATAIAAAVMFPLASADRRMVTEAERDERDVIVGVTLAKADRLERDANRKSAAGVGLLAGGGALLLSSFVWWLVEEAI